VLHNSLRVVANHVVAGGPKDKDCDLLECVGIAGHACHMARMVSTTESPDSSMQLRAGQGLSLHS
jgi:hypothetical protein